MLFSTHSENEPGIPAHKMVLSSCSTVSSQRSNPIRVQKYPSVFASNRFTFSEQFFAAMFDTAPTANQQQPFGSGMQFVVLPPEISHIAMQALVQYMYCGEAFVNKDMLDEVLHGGAMLKIDGLHIISNSTNPAAVATDVGPTTAGAACSAPQQTQQHSLVNDHQYAGACRTQSHDVDRDNVERDEHHEDLRTSTPSHKYVPHVTPDESSALWHHRPAAADRPHRRLDTGTVIVRSPHQLMASPAVNNSTAAKPRPNESYDYDHPDCYRDGHTNAITTTSSQHLQQRQQPQLSHHNPRIQQRQKATHSQQSPQQPHDEPDQTEPDHQQHQMFQHPPSTTDVSYPMALVNRRKSLNISLEPINHPAPEPTRITVRDPQTLMCMSGRPSALSITLKRTDDPAAEQSKTTTRRPSLAISPQLSPVVIPVLISKRRQTMHSPPRTTMPPRITARTPPRPTPSPPAVRPQSPPQPPPHFMRVKDEPIDWQDDGVMETVTVKPEMMFHTDEDDASNDGEYDRAETNDNCATAAADEHDGNGGAAMMMYVPLTCEQCNRTFTEPAEWARHIEEHARVKAAAMTAKMTATMSATMTIANGTAVPPPLVQSHGEMLADATADSGGTSKKRRRVEKVSVRVH